ncbi:hypothetical protein MsAm2_12650 [Methanolapillus ohkumae]|uniref:AmmeMemoRadiSam system protein B n=1 Tax=Methanolapillus ohkumae TaxID=3028298 RepID=A0AA96V8Z6_9EURY|nr:hypothetical protein MsAm2_12650 [Methanosarcinaceae archaeon Am2]
MGPNHTGLGHPLSLSTISWQTPLGTIEADTFLASYFEGTDVVVDEAAHTHEHSIEVILPFLQRKLKGRKFKILPICMGDQSSDAAELVASIITNILIKDVTVQKKGYSEKLRIAVIASSDFSHYVSPQAAQETDRKVIRKIEELDVDGFYETIEKENASLCGYGPIAALMMISKNVSASPKFLKYMTSDAETESRTNVVGYAAFNFTLNDKNNCKCD